MMVYERDQLRDKGVFFFDNREIPNRIEISEQEIKVIGRGKELSIPKNSLRGKAILDRLGIGKESELSQEIYL
ncbi:hypothetical protein [Thermocrinis sp.]